MCPLASRATFQMLHKERHPPMFTSFWDSDWESSLHLEHITGSCGRRYRERDRDVLVSLLLNHNLNSPLIRLRKSHGWAWSEWDRQYTLAHNDRIYPSVLLTYALDLQLPTFCSAKWISYSLTLSDYLRPVFPTLPKSMLLSNFAPGLHCTYIIIYVTFSLKVKNKDNLMTLSRNSWASEAISICF